MEIGDSSTEQPGAATSMIALSPLTDAGKRPIPKGPGPASTSPLKLKTVPLHASWNCSWLETHVTLQWLPDKSRADRTKICASAGRTMYFDLLIYTLSLRFLARRRNRATEQPSQSRWAESGPRVWLLGHFGAGAINRKKGRSRGIQGLKGIATPGPSEKYQFLSNQMPSDTHCDTLRGISRVGTGLLAPLLQFSVQEGLSWTGI